MTTDAQAALAQVREALRDEATRQWRPVVGYKGKYEVSDDGLVRSIARPRARARVLAQVESNGYMRVTLQNGKDRRMLLVHRLVLEAFVSQCPDGYEAAHMDGDRRNNTVGNLQWLTRKENAAHRKIHGTELYGESANNAKLTWRDVKEIRSLWPQNTQKAIGQRFGVDQKTISRVVRGATYRARDALKEQR